MVVLEQVPLAESPIQMPTPGTLAHLQYLFTLETAPYSEGETLEDIMSATGAARSLSIFIKQQRTYRPLQTSYIEFDSRLLDLGVSQVPVVSGSLYRNPHYPDRCQLSVRGQPKPGKPDEVPYTYGFMTPILYDFTYDPTRPSQAYYRYGGDPKKPISGSLEIYNQSAYQEYGENNPEILVKAFKEAAGSIVSIMNVIYDQAPGPSFDSAVQELTGDHSEGSEKLSLGWVLLAATIRFGKNAINTVAKRSN